MRAASDEAITSKLGSRTGLPIILLLLQFNCSGNSCICATLAKSFRDNLCISRANVSSIGGLAALLQLGCENRDCDSDEHSSERIVRELLILLHFPSPTRKCILAAIANIMRNGGFLTIAQKWYGLRKNGYHCA